MSDEGTSADGSRNVKPLLEGSSSLQGLKHMALPLMGVGERHHVRSNEQNRT